VEEIVVLALALDWDATAQSAIVVSGQRSQL
jgi:hypothetical protein